MQHSNRSYCNSSSHFISLSFLIHIRIYFGMHNRGLSLFHLNPYNFDQIRPAGNLEAKRSTSTLAAEGPHKKRWIRKLLRYRVRNPKRWRLEETCGYSNGKSFKLTSELKNLKAKSQYQGPKTLDLQPIWLYDHTSAPRELVQSIPDQHPWQTCPIHIMITAMPNAKEAEPTAKDSFLSFISWLTIPTRVTRVQWRLTYLEG